MEEKEEDEDYPLSNTTWMSSATTLGAGFTWDRILEIKELFNLRHVWRHSGKTQMMR